MITKPNINPILKSVNTLYRLNPKSLKETLSTFFTNIQTIIAVPKEFAKRKMRSLIVDKFDGSMPVVFIPKILLVVYSKIPTTKI
jgi:hypothetical protein